MRIVEVPQKAVVFLTAVTVHFENYFARIHESAPQRIHFTPRPIGFEGSFARTAKYLSVSVERGSMCLQFVHSAKWKRP